MKNAYDVIVIGLGVMGAAAVWRVAQKGAHVLGIDASGPTHCFGSSHGGSRIFRRAYWEGRRYLPLLEHADLLWNELEHATHQQLLFRTGGIFIGPQSSRVVSGSIQTAREGGIEHEVWTSSRIRRRFPAFNILEDAQAVYEPGAYAISACEARLGMLNEAVRHGATTQFGDAVFSLENHGAGLRVTTRSGCSYFTKAVIATTGPWMTHLIPELIDCLKPRNVPLYWFKPKKDSEQLFSQAQFPVFLYESHDGSLLYGMPSIISNEPGVKIGFHNRQQAPAVPDWKIIPVTSNHSAQISEVIDSLLPALDRSPIHMKNCVYTMSPDESFLIGQSHAFNSTYFASACSGHGFKFAPAIGDALANMAVGQQPRVTLSAFSANRFDSTPHKF